MYDTSNESYNYLLWIILKLLFCDAKQQELQKQEARGGQKTSAPKASFKGQQPV